MKWAMFEGSTFLKKGSKNKVVWPNGQTSFIGSLPFSLNGYTVYSLIQAEKPTTTAEQNVVLNSVPTLVEGVAVQSWTVVSITREELLAWCKLQLNQVKKTKIESKLKVIVDEQNLLCRKGPADRNKITQVDAMFGRQLISNVSWEFDDADGNEIPVTITEAQFVEMAAMVALNEQAARAAYFTGLTALNEMTDLELAEFDPASYFVSVPNSVNLDD